jgi:hypothetical protein
MQLRPRCLIQSPTRHRAVRLCLPEQASSVLAAHHVDCHPRPSAAAAAEHTETEGEPAEWRAHGGLDSGRTWRWRASSAGVSPRAQLSSSSPAPGTYSYDQPASSAGDHKPDRPGVHRAPDHAKLSLMPTVSAETQFSVDLFSTLYYKASSVELRARTQAHGQRTAAQACSLACRPQHGSISSTGASTIPAYSIPGRTDDAALAPVGQRGRHEHQRRERECARVHRPVRLQPRALRHPQRPQRLAQRRRQRGHVRTHLLASAPGACARARVEQAGLGARGRGACCVCSAGTKPNPSTQTRQLLLHPLHKQ